jgi:UDP-glucose 4-epimerase
VNDKLVLVTGGAGFVGIPTVGRLLSEGFSVVVADNFSIGSRQRLEALGTGSSLEIVELDIRDAASTREAVGAFRPWAILHLAAIHFIPYCVAHPAETLAVNVTGLQHVLDAAKTADVRRFLFASTGDVYRGSPSPHAETDPTTPTNVYGASKLMGEWLLRFWRVGGAAADTTVARLFNVYGPGETNAHVIPDILHMIRRGNTLPVGNLAPRRDYVYVDDVADILVQLLKFEGRDSIVNVGTGRSWRVDELITAIGAITGRPLHAETDARRLRPNDRENLQADISRLQSLLPRVTPRSLNEGLAQLLSAEGLLQGSAHEPAAM